MSYTDRLPDCYRKDTAGNNYRLLSIAEDAGTELREDISVVSLSLDINHATGKTLDLYGEMLQQRRGYLNDDQYRYMLLARIGRNTSQGDYDSVMSSLVLMFGTTQSEISLDDLELVEEDTPCVVKLTKFPVQVLINAGFSSKQAVAMIESLLPICVTLSADNFEGTFEFSASADDYDVSAGMADVEQTIGGYLGLYLGDDDKIPVLPL